MDSYSVFVNREWGPALPITITMTFHALRVSYEVRKLMQVRGRLHWAHEVFLLLTLSFGGGILTSLLLGRPQPWLINSAMVPTYSLVYLAVGFFPGDLVYKLLRACAPLSDIVLASLDGIIRGYGIPTAGVEHVRSLEGPISRSLSAMLIIGTVLGCGGGIIEDFIQISRPQWQLRTPTLLQRPNYDICVSFITAVFYIISTRAWTFRSVFTTLSVEPFDWIFPQLHPLDARVMCGLFCTVALAWKAYRDHQRFTPFLAKIPKAKSPSASVPANNTKTPSKKFQ
ncbi:hypothetical protein IWQ61_003340 [Dispira simplex]|nr:hypothetical protein IWQ61_003340 [Dispira simplex]